ncbi:MAG: translation initiation factor IF-2, partial [Paludibacteraceae bacterium]|nr:translation initiation factor IF-2 [Paludibacteraceae bacterium]
MAIKLIKACKELNIGMSTLTAFCEKHGHPLDADPNVRIDDDLYLLLAKEFNKDMATKLEADRQAAERQERIAAPTVSVEQKEPKHIETTVPQPKVVGKIDLDAEKKAAEEAAKKAAEEAEKAKAEEARKAAEEARRAAEAEAKAKAEAEAAAAAKLAAEKAAKEKAEREKAAIKQEEEFQHASKKKEIFTLGKPELKHAPKVVGKIDLDSIDTSTRPAKKTKEQKRKEREERQQALQAQQQAAAEKRKRERIKGAAKVDPNDKRNQSGKGNKGKKIQPREATQEEVEKALKETLNRLQQPKGKSNTSKYKRERREQEREKHELEVMEAQEQSKVLKLTEFVTANDLANMMNVPVNKIIGTCMSLGLFVSINQRLDAETINLVAEEFGFQTEYVAAHVAEEINADEVVDDADLQPRCPIITVMGHVDHGKTSLLDHIRNANVIAGEAGGITQHIGAYNVKLKNGQHITFLDTPGHAAFTAMRARGAKVTDIAIIIIAADDAVMPQTVEAINHAQAAGVPMIFAINKVDKPGANPDKIREQLSNMNILVEDWGGKYQCQEISAKKGTGVYELLEKVLLEAELLELKANPKRRAKGSVIESSLDKGRGYVATLLVQDGTLHMGDIVLAGTFHGRIKAMFNERGQKITEVHPGEPCSILGLNGAPQAGDEFNVLPTEQEARDIATKREQLQREQSIRTKKHIGLEEIGRRMAIGDFKELNVIVKADVDGSVEAIKDSLIKLSTENIQVNVIHGAVGAISDSDVMLAAASDAMIVGFNVRPTGTARKMAETEEVDIRIYSIIYDAIN